MPIVEENGSVYVEYHMPENIKNLITVEFLTEFRNQLIRIFEYWSLSSFEDYGIPANTSTGGWNAAFVKTCINKNLKELYAYYRTLPWYDSDIFDGELADMLTENHLILGPINTYTKKYLNIDAEDICTCCDCGDFYLKKDAVKLSEEEVEVEYSEYRCKNCKENVNSDNSQKFEVSTIEKMLEKYILDIVSNELNIDRNELIYCPNCKGVYTKDMGIYHKDEFKCNYCNDFENSKDNEFKTTDYYRNCLEEIKKINWDEISIPE